MGKYIAAALLIPLMLTGCSDQVKIAKNAPSLADNYTNEQVLDNDPNCENTDWKMFKDSTGRELVEYTCTVRVLPEMRDAAKKRALASLQDEVNRQAGFYTAARLQAEKNAIEGGGGIKVELMRAQQRLEGAQYRVNVTQNSAGATHQQALSELQSAQESHQRVSAQIAEFQAKAEPIMMQIVNFEDAYSTALQKLEAEDTKTIEDHFAKTIKMDRKVYFLVKGENVDRVAHIFSVGGRELNPQQVYLDFALRSHETPGMQKQAAEFWAEQQPWPVMSIKKFPYDCNPERGCIDRTKPS